MRRHFLLDRFVRLARAREDRRKSRGKATTSPLTCGISEPSASYQWRSDGIFFDSAGLSCSRAGRLCTRGDIEPMVSPHRCILIALRVSSAVLVTLSRRLAAQRANEFPGIAHMAL